ncbi:MAG: hypothetical protein LBI42_00425 [Chitinispirillales bacterium]|nr:hypothetical protein [Chitinispirillales bacterium]
MCCAGRSCKSQRRYCPVRLSLSHR